jgi:putative Ca2+/H+ antiporter (TMEM165/GDT1 family)
LFESTLADFAAIAGTLFIVELTDKDALLILALATQQKPVRVFLAGSVAFLFTTTVIVVFGTLLITFVQVDLIRLAGGAIMLGYGALLVSRILRRVGGQHGEGEAKGASAGFAAMVGSLALLDLAGDATEIIIVVLLARYGDPYLVFVAGYSGLIAAVAVETALGNVLGRVLTPRRLLYLSAVIFLALGSYILALSL